MTQLTDLVDVRTVAERLGILPRSVLKRIQTGSIAATKVGAGRTSAYVITAAELDRLTAEAEQAAAARSAS